MQTRDEYSKNFSFESHPPCGERLEVHSPDEEELALRFSQKRHQDLFSATQFQLRGTDTYSTRARWPTAPIDQWHGGYPDRGPYRSAA